MVELNRSLTGSDGLGSLDRLPYVFFDIGLGSRLFTRLTLIAGRGVGSFALSLDAAILLLDEYRLFEVVAFVSGVDRSLDEPYFGVVVVLLAAVFFNASFSLSSLAVASDVYLLV